MIRRGSFVQWLARCVCVLVLAMGVTARAADLPVDHLCDRESIFTDGQLVPDLNWQAPKSFEFEVAPGATCWMRFSMPAQEPASFNGTQFLRISQEQGQEIFLYDARGKLVAAALQDGRNIGSISSQTLAVFPVHENTPRTLYGKVRSTNLLYDVHVSIDRNDHARVISDGQRRDAISAVLMGILMTVGVFSAFYAVLTKEKPYMLFSAYALLTAVQIFGNYGVSLPFGINTANALSLLAEPASNILLILTVLSVGGFVEHCLTCALWLGISAFFSAVQIAWLLLLINGWVAPSWQSDWFYGFQYGATNVLSLAIVWGGIQSWRRGVPVGLALAVGAAPRAALWVGHSEVINTLVLGVWPSGLGFTDPIGVIGLLALPMLLLAAIAVRSRNAQREVVQLARTDPLTGLPNRDWLIQLGELQRAKGTDMAVLVADVDRFKAIVEVLGYQAVDTVMLQVSHRLGSIPGVTLGKSQDTHFCMLCAEPLRLKSLRNDLSQAFSEPIQVRDHWLDVSLSIGVAEAAGQSVANLMRNAEVALDAAKKLRLGWLMYDPQMQTSRPENLSMLSELNAAIANNEFKLYLQPKLRMSDGTVHSAEALIRWFHPVKGMIPPNQFIPFAEQTGKIRAITLWVLKEVAQLTKMLRDQGRPLLISANLSALDLQDEDFVVRIFNLVDAVGALPGDVRLEVTESGVMDDPEGSLVTLHALKSAGFSLSIDDFGTGYSSLSYLQRMPVTEVKIDRSFVHRVRSESEGAALLDFIVALGHRLGLTVVAEGVETNYEWHLLKDLGCDEAQGWLAAKAMPVQEFLRWCEDHDPFLPPSEA